MKSNCLPPFRDITAIAFRAYEQDLFRQGAAALALEQVYRDAGPARAPEAPRMPVAAPGPLDD